MTIILPLPPRSPINISEILYGVEEAVGRGIYFMSNVRRRMDIFFDHRAPSIVIDVEEYRNGYIDIRKRGAKIRALTEVTKENVSYCKELMKLVDELRHLDGVKGGMSVNESEYMATTVLQEAKPLTQVIYSNVREVVEQGQYIFDTLWNAAIPAQYKIREIEEGIIPYETRIIENNPDEIIRRIRHLTENSNELATSLTSGGMQFSYNYFFDIKKKLIAKQKRGEHKGIRYITTIDKENIQLSKEYLQSGIQVRHVKNLPPMNFGISDKEMAATIEKMEAGKMVRSLLVSNEPVYLKHFTSIFEELWNNGIDAADRIRDIEAGIDLADIEIIQNPKEGITRTWNIVKSAREEILILFSSVNALRRQIKMGALELIKEISEVHGVKVRLLIPDDTDDHMPSTILEVKSLCTQVDIRSMDRSVCTRITIILVDRKECTIIELKDDTKDLSYDAAGLSTYTNTKSIVSSYVSIFESLWKQTELYEQIKVHNKMQEEFIDVAAHELRTPIQPILALSQHLIAEDTTIDTLHRHYLEIIARNAVRLQQLTENILDVTRIENHSMKLKKEPFSLNDILSRITEDYRDHIGTTNVNVKLSYGRHNGNDPLEINADKVRITQVISNLLSNSIKFTKEGIVSIISERKENQVIVNIKDTGEGIDEEIFPKLFTKFVSKSFSGTGLGLYISKSIIEAHGGKIWAENNPGQKGASFKFNLPIVELKIKS